MGQMASVAAPLSFVVWLGLTVLFIAAWVQIVTKAGYSGWWVLVPLSAGAFWLAAIAVGVGSFINSLQSGGVFGSNNGLAVPARLDSTGLDVAGVLALIAFILFIVSWILFYVFAFSHWPVLRHQHRGPASLGARAQDPLPFSPGPGTAAGWYPVGPTNNDQAYWDGQTWTARKKWEGAGWVDVPLTGSRPST
jgi:hypothetical protein